MHIPYPDCFIGVCTVDFLAHPSQIDSSFVQVPCTIDIMGCQGSKTVAAAASKPDEQPAVEKTLLQEPAVEDKTEMPQESAISTAQQDNIVEAPASVPPADAGKAEVAETFASQGSGLGATPKAVEEAATQDGVKSSVEEQSEVQKNDLCPVATTTVVEEKLPAEEATQSPSVEDDITTDAVASLLAVAEAEASPDEKLAAEMPESPSLKVTSTSGTAGPQRGCLYF